MGTLQIPSWTGLTIPERFNPGYVTNCNILGILGSENVLCYPTAMNNALIASMQQSDGRYLSDAELRPLAQFVASFESRFKTYTRIKDEGEGLVKAALRQLMTTEHRLVIQEHGGKCQRDMLYTLECIAKAILLDNPDGFIEEYVMWMQNITRALHKESSAIDAYRSLQTEITAALPQEAAQLINGYLDKLITAFAEGM